MKTIVWDVDDVLNELTAAWLREVPGSIRFDELTQNPPHELLGIPLSDYLDSLDRFRVSDAGQSLPPRADVLQWFEEHGPNFRHIALTSTPAFNASASAAWVMKHFGRWIRVFGFVPSPRPNDSLPQYDETKQSFLQWWEKADYLVDDRPETIAAARAIGITALTMPQPWNGATENPLAQLR